MCVFVIARIVNTEAERGSTKQINVGEEIVKGKKKKTKVVRNAISYSLVSDKYAEEAKTTKEVSA